MWTNRSPARRSRRRLRRPIKIPAPTKNLLVYLFGRLIRLPYFALDSNHHTSYVAERRGGGPHDLLRGFDSFRNCKNMCGKCAFGKNYAFPGTAGPKISDCFYGNNG